MLTIKISLTVNSWKYLANCEKINKHMQRRRQVKKLQEAKCFILESLAENLSSQGAERIRSTYYLTFTTNFTLIVWNWGKIHTKNLEPHKYRKAAYIHKCIYIMYTGWKKNYYFIIPFMQSPSQKKILCQIAAIPCKAICLI